MHRIYLAFLCFFRVLFGKPIPDEVLPPMPAPPLLEGAKPPPDSLYTQKTAPVKALPPDVVAAQKAKTMPLQPAPHLPEKPAAPAAAQPVPGQGFKDGALQLLALLQREGRLVDFLREAIDGYDDATVGAAVRDIHRGCKKAIDDHFTLEPVMGGAENDRVSVAIGFDASRIRLVGNVSGQPPFSGTLRHHGWAATRIKLPQVTGQVDHTVVAPAEVEI
jgi:hypothetical protein